jgi:acid stress-induced BolA-like protein IbaG/YrbA
MIFRASGADIVSNIDVSGNGNAFNILATGNKHSQVVNVSGDNNNFNLTQTSTGANGSSIQIAQQGTGATFTVQQSGSVDNVLRINSVANGGSFSILQRN